MKEMKKIFWVFLGLFFFVPFFAQAQEGNIGLFVGTSYYNGELNPRQPFYMPSPSAGAMYRHNFNKRWAFRIDADYLGIRGDDSKSTNAYQKNRNYNFDYNIWDIGLQFELNFYDFNKENYMNEYFTPYISTGAYLTYNKPSQKPLFASIPFEFGMKYAYNKKITFGGWWQYRWTTTDYVDNLTADNFSKDMTLQRSNNTDMDWLATFGFFVTIKVFGDDMPCPAFGSF